MKNLAWINKDDTQIATAMPGVWRITPCENQRTQLSLTIGDEEVETISREYADASTARRVAEAISGKLQELQPARVEFVDYNPKLRNYWGFRLRSTEPVSPAELVYDPYADKWAPSHY